MRLVKCACSPIVLMFLVSLVNAMPIKHKPLVVHWFGTSSYLIQFGSTSLLTDPFYSQSSLIQTGIGNVESNPNIVHEIIHELEPFAKPKAIFIGHSHYDHMLDTANLVNMAHWSNIPIYGSQTTLHILEGYKNFKSDTFRKTKTDSQWHPVAKGIRYKAFIAEHAANLPHVLFYPGEVKESLKKPPNCAADFRLGKTYAYVFELTDGEDKAMIYFVGAASTAPVGFPDPSIQKIDLAILCVPSWQYTAGYPEKFIERLRPSYILPSHYNDFFQPINDFYEQRQFLRVAGFKSFLKKVDEYTDYPRFKKILIPKVNQTLNLNLS